MFYDSIRVTALRPERTTCRQDTSAPLLTSAVDGGTDAPKGWEGTHSPGAFIDETA